ncbi:MAG: hypothetical protein P8Y97_12975 [Candidatus Lokiarchaeota archaeon]
MCNVCDCEEYEKCSIVGYIPLGFCCPKCNFYEAEGACVRSKMNVQKKIPVSLKDETGKVNLFPDKFCLKKKSQVLTSKIDDI